MCCVADTDAEAERIGHAMFNEMYDYRDDTMAHYQKLKGVNIRPPEGVPARNIPENTRLIWGSPATRGGETLERSMPAASAARDDVQDGADAVRPRGPRISLFMRHVAPLHFPAAPRHSTLIGLT